MSDVFYGDIAAFEDKRKKLHSSSLQNAVEIRGNLRGEVQSIASVSVLVFCTIIEIKSYVLNTAIWK